MGNSCLLSCILSCQWWKMTWPRGTLSSPSARVGQLSSLFLYPYSALCATNERPLGHSAYAPLHLRPSLFAPFDLHAVAAHPTNKKRAALVLDTGLFGFFYCLLSCLTQATQWQMFWYALVLKKGDTPKATLSTQRDLLLGCPIGPQPTDCRSWTAAQGRARLFLNWQPLLVVVRHLSSDASLSSFRSTISSSDTAMWRKVVC